VSVDAEVRFGSSVCLCQPVWGGFGKNPLPTIATRFPVLRMKAMTSAWKRVIVPLRLDGLYGVKAD